jgi:metallo-beta-lactamase class B
MRRRLIAAAFAVAAGAVLAGAAGAQKDAAERAAWNQPVAPFRIVGDVYYVGVAGLSSFLVTTPEGHVLIDGGLPESAPRIEANIAALGFRVRDVKFLLNSHAHYDHAGGLAALKRATGARLIASRGDAPALAAGRPDFGAPAEFPPVAVDRVITDGDTVRLGGVVLTAHLTPGHTRGCTSWTLPVTDGGRKLDVLFHCSTSAPGYRLVDNPQYPQIAADYRRSFAALRALPCDVLLAPHSFFFRLDDKRARLARGGPNPFIDPAECRAFIAESERDFDEALARQRR